MSDPNGLPLRLCVDHFLAEHLQESAGKLAVSERPSLAVQATPRVLEHLAQPGGDVPEEVFFQRLGLLREGKWAVGRTISIGFYNDAPAGIPSKIMAILEQSSEVLNLAWRQVPVGRAEYRVSFVRGNGLWSMIGSQSLMVQGQPTCNLGDVDWNNPRDLVRCVRHEIVGHGTGALHAQSLPSYSQIVDLDFPAIIRYYMASQGWTYQQAAAQFEKVSSAQVEEGLQSRTSIMAYEIDPRFDRRGVGVPWNWDWDQTDQSQFRKSYPGAGGPVPPPNPIDVKPPDVGDVPVLDLNMPAPLLFPPGGMARAAFSVDGPTSRVVRIIEGASGSPLLDVVPAGGSPQRIDPKPGVSGLEFLSTFSFRLAAAGRYELHIQFRGPAPASFVVILSEA